MRTRMIHGIRWRRIPTGWATDQYAGGATFTARYGTSTRKWWLCRAPSGHALVQCHSLTDLTLWLREHLTSPETARKKETT